MAKATKKKKSNRHCEGINKTTGRVKTGFKYKKGGGCPIPAKSSLKAKKTSAPKSARRAKTSLHPDVFYVPGLTKAQKAALEVQAREAAYHSGSRAHATSRDAYFENLRQQRTAAETAKVMRKLKKNKNAGAVASWQMEEMFPGMGDMAGLRGFRGLRGHGRGRRSKRARSR